MALVDYASSSSGEEEVEEESRHGAVSEAVADGVEQLEAGINDVYGPQPSSLPPPLTHNHPSPSSSSLPLPNRTSNAPSTMTHVLSQSAPNIALPDASVLFASQTANINSSRKRDSNGSARQFLPNKASRLNIPRSRNMVDGSSLLVPPQLRGRSNVATEDIGNLFVHRRSGNP